MISFEIDFVGIVGGIIAAVCYFIGRWTGRRDERREQLRH